MSLLNITRTVLASTRNYGRQRKEKDIKYIVIHYTGNDGDSALANCKYFQTGGRNASAHIFVDDKEAILSVPLNYVAWSVGGKKYSDCAKTGGGKLYGKATNANSINIELCGTNGYKPNDKELKRALELTRQLMKKYSIDASHVIRHFDVTGKSCPAYWTNDDLWRKEFHNKLTKKTTKSYTYFTKAGKYQVIKQPRAIREAASNKAKIVGYIKDSGVYTITKVEGQTVKYGKLKSGAGYICLRSDYVKQL